MNKHKNLTFRLILRKKYLGPSRFEPSRKLHSGLYSVNRMSNQLNKISLLSIFSWQLNAKKTFLDIIYGFLVMVMRRVAPFKKNISKDKFRDFSEF